MHYDALHPASHKRSLVHQPLETFLTSTAHAHPAPVDYQTHPSQYRHWKLSFEGPVATLAADFDENAGLRPGYKLKLNSYDLGVDIELNDAVQRIRFEHPEVRTVIVTSAKEKVFCSGANIFMLGVSSHAWKVNFCKFTNETRNGLEDSSKYSGLKFLAAVNGACAGGGYELALACDEIILVDDRNSAVSLPGGAAAGRAARHRRPHPRDRQAPRAPRPGRHLLHHGRRRARAEGGGLAAGGRSRQAQPVRRPRAGARRSNSPPPAIARPRAKGVALTPLQRTHRSRRAALLARHRGDRPRSPCRHLHGEGACGPGGKRYRRHRGRRAPRGIRSWWRANWRMRSSRCARTNSTSEPGW